MSASRRRPARGRRRAAVALAALLALLGCEPARLDGRLAPSGGSPAAPPTASPVVPSPEERWEAVREGVGSALAADAGAEVRLNLVAAESPGAVDALTAAVARHGGVVERRLDGAGFVVARVPARLAAGLVAEPSVAAASVVGEARLTLARPASPDGAEPDGGAGAEPAGVPQNPSLPTPPPPPEAAILAAPARTARPSLDAIAAGEARALRPADGSGAVVALIDTGADPHHPALRLTTDGSAKIVDWLDFSGEGDVRTSEVRVSPDGELRTTHGDFRAPPDLSAGGAYRFGLLREENLNPEGGLHGDLNGDGDARDAFGVLVVDRSRPGEYDALIVDTNGNNDFTDDGTLREFRNGGDVGSFPPVGEARRAPLHFLASRISPDGSLVQIGFDGHGHGTQVASIAAGNPPGQPDLAGVAPGARLLILKALDSAGDGSWDRISEAMAYAADRRAQVISLSVAGVTPRNGGLQAETVLMSRLSRIHDVLFTVAAGNGGPGLGSASPPGEAADVVIAGAFMTPAMWQSYWQYDVPQPAVAEFSAVGPRPDGAAGPTLVAPGAGFAGVPEWVDGSGYALTEGTSVAVPHVAGAAAIALDLARRAGVLTHFQLLKRALEASAVPLPGHSFAEQGWGALHLGNLTRLIHAAAALDAAALPPPSRLQVDRPAADSAGGAMEPVSGIYARGAPPASAALRLSGASAGGVRLRWAATVPWLSVPAGTTYLPDAATRTLQLQLDAPSSPGLHTGVFAGYTTSAPRAGGPADPTQLFRAVELPVTVVQPLRFEAGNGYRHSLRGTLLPGARQRYFFEVPEGADALDLSLRVPRRAAEGRAPGDPAPASGRVRLTLVGPDGHTVVSPGPVGAGAAGERASDLYRHRVSSPLPGIWEAVVFSLPDQGRFGLSDSDFELEAGLSGVIFPGGTVHLVAGAGASGTLRQRVDAVNLDRAFTGRVIAAGFGRRAAATPADLISIADGEIARISLGEIPAQASWLHVSLANPSHPGGSLEPMLWRYDTTRQAWVLVDAQVQAGASQQTIDLADPPPGRYTLMVAASQLPAKRVELQVRHEVFVAGGDLKVTDADRARKPGEPWEIELQAALPAQPGRYFGRLAVYDAEARRLIGSTPVILYRSQRTPLVRALPRTAETAPVAIEVRDRDSGERLEATLTVGGRQYSTREGIAQVAFPLPSAGDSRGSGGAAANLHMVVEGLGIARTEVSVPVPPATPPRAPRAEAELELLRRKVEAQSTMSGGRSNAPAEGGSDQADGS